MGGQGWGPESLVLEASFLLAVKAPRVEGTQVPLDGWVLRIPGMFYG